MTGGLFLENVIYRLRERDIARECLWERERGTQTVRDRQADTEADRNTARSTDRHRKAQKGRHSNSDREGECRPRV